MGVILWAVVVAALFVVHLFWLGRMMEDGDKHESLYTRRTEKKSHTKWK